MSGDIATRDEVAAEVEANVETMRPKIQEVTLQVRQGSTCALACGVHGAAHAGCGTHRIVAQRWCHAVICPCLTFVPCACYRARGVRMAAVVPCAAAQILDAVNVDRFADAALVKMDENGDGKVVRDEFLRKFLVVVNDMFNPQQIIQSIQEAMGLLKV